MKLKIKELFEKYKEIINYLIIGVLTTVINYAIYVIAIKSFVIDIFTSNIIAWIITVIVAYFLNKQFVFESKSYKLNVIGREIISFGLARIFSLLLEEAILFIFVEKFSMNELIIKLIANIVVIVVNYVLSKFIIFKKKNQKM